MASVRLLSFPSVTHFSTHHQFLSPPPSFHRPHHPISALSHLSLSLSAASSSLSRLSLLFPFKTQKSTIFLFHFSSSIQTQATSETPAQSETMEKEEVVGEASQTRLIAQNVPWSSTPDDLRPLFEKYGTVVDIELSMYNKTRSRGLAFVTMSSHEEALAAISNLESYEFEGRILKLNWARPRPTKPTSPRQPNPAPIHNLFVANLPFQARSKDLKEFFNANNANVVSAEVIFNENPRRSAGYGFVSFNTKGEADAALTSFQGKDFMGRSIRVANSKRFLRQNTVVDMQSEIIASENPDDSNQRTLMDVEA